MSRILAVHGIAQQLKGEAMQHGLWFPAMRDGVVLAGGDVAPEDLRCVSYGHLFRRPGRGLSSDLPPLGPADVDSEFDLPLLLAWWEEAARVDDEVVAPDARSLARTGGSAQAALRALSGSKFFANLAMRSMIFDLHQVRRYFTELTVRAQIQARLEECVTDDTQVMVAHSLGSAVAYEALVAHPEWPVTDLITIGSPLGIRNLIFDRLEPRPVPAGGLPRGSWPRGIARWTNLADSGDIVALVKDLRPLFGDDVRSFLVHNGTRAHNVAPYLTAPETGAAIVAGLTG
ncbi:hypothetical protein [Streptomyces hyaluromycini]|uniref:hypothetical protein n=1 Tax=Streptomyces hyaluromycini TaxID=1377993 RepID=UPI0012383668|nr:hypothetical protein [Streptomyces hyaluromycini]